MYRKRIGAKQRELLLRLEFIGPVKYSDLDRDGRRGAGRLEALGLVRIVRSQPGPWDYVELVNS